MAGGSSTTFRGGKSTGWRKRKVPPSRFRLCALEEIWRQRCRKPSAQRSLLTASCAELTTTTRCGCPRFPRFLGPDLIPIQRPSPSTFDPSEFLLPLSARLRNRPVPMAKVAARPPYFLNAFLLKQEVASGHTRSTLDAGTDTRTPMAPARPRTGGTRPFQASSRV